MIRGIITDIDGVIVGDKVGFNSPFPHPDVLARIKKIHDSGIPVTLCTGKPHYAVGQIIRVCGLNNPHITDGGAIIIDPITNTIVKKHVMDPSLVAGLVASCLRTDMYVEIYTEESYIIQKSQVRENLTPIHEHILQTAPVIVDDLVEEAKNHEIVKVMPVATDEEDKKRLISIYEPYKDQLTLAFGLHPIANPHQFGLITAKGVSKKQSAIDATSALQIPLRDYLGIGDSTSDWSFMELCGYAATIGNGSSELKKLVVSKEDHGFIAEHSVDENGALTILDYFGL